MLPDGDTRRPAGRAGAQPSSAVGSADNTPVIGFAGHTLGGGRVDHGPVAVEPVTPQGVTLRTGPGDEAFRRTGYALLAESFREHYGFVDPTFEQWHEIREAEPGFDWSKLTIAYLDGQPVGVLLTGDEFVEAENCGHVGDIGVLAEARGRGIAKFLLRTAFAADIRAGRVATNLTVDTNNVTPALRLYESVGM